MRALTAGEVVNRIKAVMAVQGVPWNDATTRDRFKFGGPDTVVTGIATTFMGTFEAITKASELGLNLIIPHEDTYWNDAGQHADRGSRHAGLQDEGRLHDEAQHRDLPDPRSHAPAAAGLHVLRHRARGRPRSDDGNGAEFPPVRHSGDDARRARRAREEGPRRRRHPRRRRSGREGQPHRDRRRHGDAGGQRRRRRRRDRRRAAGDRRDVRQPRVRHGRGHAGRRPRAGSSSATTCPRSRACRRWPTGCGRSCRK